MIPAPANHLYLTSVSWNAFWHFSTCKPRTSVRGWLTLYLQFSSPFFRYYYEEDEAKMKDQMRKRSFFRFKWHAKSARVIERFSFTVILALSPALVSPFQGVDDKFVAFVDEVWYSDHQASFHGGWLAAGGSGCPLDARLGFYNLHVDS